MSNIPGVQSVPYRRKRRFGLKLWFFFSLFFAMLIVVLLPSTLWMEYGKWLMVLLSSFMVSKGIIILLAIRYLTRKGNKSPKRFAVSWLLSSFIAGLLFILDLIIAPTTLKKLWLHQFGVMLESDLEMLMVLNLWLLFVLIGLFLSEAIQPYTSRETSLQG
jgi:hypothetical protein